MARAIEDSYLYDIGFMWENQTWDFSNVDTSSESQEKLAIALLNQNEGNGGENLMNKKQRQDIAHGNGKRVIDREIKDGKSCVKGNNEIIQRVNRERRKKMMSMFGALHALLPGLSHKADKCEIVDEAVSRIKYLKEMLEKLEKQKKERIQSSSTIGCESSPVINPAQYPYDSKGTSIFEHGSSSNNFTGAIRNLNPSNSNILSVPQHPTEIHTWSSPNVVLNICGIEAQLSIFVAKRPCLLTTIDLVLEKHEIDIITSTVFHNGNGNQYMILAGHVNRTSYQLNQQTIALQEIYKTAAREIMLCIS